MGVDEAQLEKQILSSDSRRLQAGIALSAASRTAWPPKVVALGRALATGLAATDDVRIDTEPLIMAALADIEFPQASLLELLVCHWPSTSKDGLVAEALDRETRAGHHGRRRAPSVVSIPEAVTCLW
jgi:hypothetical protein